MSYGTIQAEKMTTESGYSLGAGNASSFKNRLINGNMRIAQRSAGPVTNSSGGVVYDAIDRWGYWAGNAGGFSTTQSTEVPAGSGFSYSALITSLGSISQGSTTYAQFCQRIEGFNIADLNWGTANAKPVTISFWIRSSLTGTFSAYLFNSGYQYCYPFTFNIPSANTWVQITQTVAGPTAGTWNTTNGIGVEFGITLLNGTSYQGTNSVWVAGNFVAGVAGSVNLLSTNGATMYITGVQLEAGTVATSFDQRAYGTELALCQRYYEQFGNGWWCSGETTNYNVVYGGSFLVPKRTAPTCSLLYTDLVIYQFGVANRNGSGCSIISASQMFTWGGQIKVLGWSTITTGQLYGGGGSVAAGFTVQPMAASAEL